MFLSVYVQKTLFDTWSRSRSEVLKSGPCCICFQILSVSVSGWNVMNFITCGCVHTTEGEDSWRIPIIEGSSWLLLVMQKVLEATLSAFFIFMTHFRTLCKLHILLLVSDTSITSHITLLHYTTFFDVTPEGIYYKHSRSSILWKRTFQKKTKAPNILHDLSRSTYLRALYSSCKSVLYLFCKDG